MKNLIQTPYGNKTPELLCRAMDALEREPELLDSLMEATRCLEWHNERHGVAMDGQAVIKSRAAIAKAKGEIK
jgi:hypothetical protein